MNRIYKKPRTHSPVRKAFSLFIVVSLLITSLQPCAMASVIDTGSSDTETHQTHPANHKAESTHPNCAHCDSLDPDGNHCDSELTKVCDESESYTNSSRSKPIDHENFDDQYQSFRFLDSSEGEIQVGQLVASEIGKSPPPFQSPKLADLFRVYLK